jgi:hypothetical protein
MQLDAWGRKKARWGEAEEKALLRNFVQMVITAGPHLESLLVPWQDLPGILHSRTASNRRINMYRVTKTEPNFAAIVKLAATVYEGRVAAARAALRAAAWRQQRSRLRRLPPPPLARRCRFR